MSVRRAFADSAYETRTPWLGRGPCGAGGAVADLAEEFHEACKIDPLFPVAALGPAGHTLVTEAGSAFELGRKALVHTGPSVPLMRPTTLPVDLTEVVCRRRSRLPEAPTALTLDQLSHVLALSAGRSPDQPELRVTPSGGALYPLDVAVIPYRVEQLDTGLYIYGSVEHALFPRRADDPHEFYARLGTGYLPPKPAVLLAVIATFARSRAKYGLRGYRFALLEAGHVVQAAITAATALGLACLPWGGFADRVADRWLDLDGLERSCVYLLAISGVTGTASADADGGL